MSEKTVDVLNNLVEINNDRIEGYKTAYEETTDVELQSLFERLKQTSVRNNEELTEAVRSLGGTPEEGTRISGKFFRAWMDVKAAFSNNDRKTILNSCEYGEDVALKTYRKTIENDAEVLDDAHQEIINKQAGLLQRDHDEVKSLRDAARHNDGEGKADDSDMPIVNNIELQRSLNAQEGADNDADRTNTDTENNDADRPNRINNPVL